MNGTERLGGKHTQGAKAWRKPGFTSCLSNLASKCLAADGERFRKCAEPNTAEL